MTKGFGFVGVVGKASRGPEVFVHSGVCQCGWSRIGEVVEMVMLVKDRARWQGKFRAGNVNREEEWKNEEKELEKKEAEEDAMGKTEENAKVEEMEKEDCWLLFLVPLLALPLPPLFRVVDKPIVFGVFGRVELFKLLLFF